MNAKQAKLVKAGTRVTFKNDVPGASEDDGSQGTVTEVLYSGFNVEWDDGITIGYKFDNARHIHPCEL
jgi:hypothetical protein